jgi:hypothetical protein
MKMSEQRQFPIDDLTGLPYAVLTVGGQRDIPFQGVTNHHHANYPRQHLDLEGKMALSGGGNVLQNLDALSLGKLGGLAVRVSRTQRMVPELHQLAHKKFPKGPPVPHELHDKFITAVKNCAGVVPRIAVDVTAPEGRELVHMHDDTFNHVAHPWNLHPEEYYFKRPSGYQQRILGSFFLRFAAEQDISHISLRIIDEFLYTSDPVKRMNRGKFILREAMEVSVATVIPEHQALKRLGMTQGDRDVRGAVWGTTSQETILPVLRLLQARLAG